MRRLLHPIAGITVALAIFFYPVFSGALPIPSDTIVGLYHPFRDLYSKDFPNGIAYKNFLITDPVRQQYPWRELAISLVKELEFPLWNPYNLAGTPLMANVQSAPLYPLNLAFIILPFPYAWSMLIVGQLLLSGIFLFYYLRRMKIGEMGSFMGSIAFVFSGFSIAWLEWNTIIHVALWLPLILLATEHLLQKMSLKWFIALVLAQASQVFSGHLQILFYSLTISQIYLLSRIIQKIIEDKKRGRILPSIAKFYTPFLVAAIIAALITAIQWVPAFSFIQESARSVDQMDWGQPGWFIPWQNLIQFIVPDFFGNPATLNYWGAWNYAEFVGYIGIFPLALAFFALFFRRDKKTFFFGTVFFVSLIFSLPTLFAKIPYILNLPFLSDAQPSRLIFTIDFSLAILAALGLDLLTKKKKGIFYPLGFIGFVFAGLWLFLYFPNASTLISAEHISIAKRNLLIPTSLFVIVSIMIYLSTKVKNSRSMTAIIYLVLICITVLDLIRFGLKFTPFSDQKYLFPQTKTIDFLKKNLGNHRYMTTDARIMASNFSAVYRLQSIDGYDPLYLRRYGEFVAALERGKADISPPFGFNRIIEPRNYDSRLIDLLGVRYVLSLTDLSSPKLKKVFQEGQTRVYENGEALPRAFFVRNLKLVSSKEEAIRVMFQEDFDPRSSAVFEPLGLGYNTPLIDEELATGSAEIIVYSPNRIEVETDIAEEGFLVLTDSYYPTWKARIYLDEKEASTDSPLSTSLLDKGTAVLRADYNFRGVIVPKGKNRIEFYNNLF